MFTNPVEVRMLRNRALAALFATGAVIALPVVGCGGGGNDNGTTNEASNASTTGTAAAATGPGGTVNLSATNYKFTPSDPTVKSGQVTFKETNNGPTHPTARNEDA